MIQATLLDLQVHKLWITADLLHVVIQAMLTFVYEFGLERIAQQPSTGQF